MYPSTSKLKAILLKESYISEEDSKNAEAASHDSAGYVAYLIGQELLTKPLLGQAIAEAYNLPYADLSVHTVTRVFVAMIPEDFAKSNRVVFVKASDKVVAVASDRPEKVDVIKLRTFFPGRTVRLAYALPEHIEEAFSLYEQQQPLGTRFSQIIESGRRIAPEIVDEIIKDALTFQASDIHFEPHETEVSVRFRVDGALRQAGAVPREHYENILNRIKVESGMRIDEHITAQDGAIQRFSGGVQVDLRVSLIPTVEGEKVVMRVLGSYIQGFTLTDIGFDEKHRMLMETYAKKPFGMILTVGPTGSGKTTTLYAALKLLNRPEVNITTIEDPVEYKIGGVNQIQVNEQANMTFARGLRSIVRQDPDVVLVGEIRDEETAEIAINAALTGHLMLSTFHSNDAATAIPRLIDMGIEPFLLASTLHVVIAQRLVRRICRRCRYSLPVDEALKEIPNCPPGLISYFPKSPNVYMGKGCSTCNKTGYNGRTALFEFIEVTPQIRELIVGSPTSQQVAQLARKQGNITMFEDGLGKVKSGVTTINEVLRMVEMPDKKA